MRIVSARLHARFLEDRSPARHLGLEILCGLLRPGIEHRLEARGDELALQLLVGHGLMGYGGQSRDDGRRRRGWREQAHEELRDEVRITRFRGGRELGRTSEALL